MPPLFARCGDVPFENLVRFMVCFDRAKKNEHKARHLAEFRDKNVVRPGDDIWAIYRLLLPQTERRRYLLQQQALATALVEACGVAKTHKSAIPVLNWKSDPSYKKGSTFSDAAEAHLFVHHAGIPTNEDPRGSALTVSDVNARLDELAALSGAGSAEERARVLKRLISRMTPRQCKWLVRIILRDLKIGLSVERTLRDFHPDAERMYNINQDLEKVFTELADPNSRSNKETCEPGDNVRHMLCDRKNSVEAAFAAVSGGRAVSKPFAVEVKMDGERIAMHARNREIVGMTSRRGLDHQEQSSYDVMSPVLLAQLTVPDAILDGEMIVWNKRKCFFEPFGTLKGTVNAAKNGTPAGKMIESDRYGAPDGEQGPLAEDIEIVFVAFDILYVTGRGSVTHLPLQTRQQLLRSALKDAPPEGHPMGPPGGAIRGRVAPLLPGTPLMPTDRSDHCAGADEASGISNGINGGQALDMVMARVGTTREDIQTMYDRAINNNEEGIVVKPLDSIYELGLRGSWVKLKPEYHGVDEVDAVVIGACKGDGWRAGEIHEFFLALPDRDREGEPPRCFKSFAKVGTGLNQQQRRDLQEKLRPLLADARGPNARPPPHFYQLSGKERPDYWITDPLQSAVLEIKADLRLMTSKQYATGYTLRFPRIKRIRYDLNPADAWSVQRLERAVNEFKGTLGHGATRGPGGSWRGGGGGGGGGGWGPRGFKKKKGPAADKGAARRTGVVPKHLMAADVSGVRVERDLLEGRRLAVLNAGREGAPPSEAAAAKKEVSELIARLGGKVIASASEEGDIYIAAYPGLKPSAFALSEAEGRPVADIVDAKWLGDCERAGELLPIKPAYYFFLSHVTRKALAGDIDIHGVPVTRDVDAADMRQIMENLMSKPTLERSLARAAPSKAPARPATRTAAGRRAVPPTLLGSAGLGSLSMSFSGVVDLEQLLMPDGWGQEGGDGVGGILPDDSDDPPLQLLVPGIERELRSMGLGAGTGAARASRLLGCHIAFVRCPLLPPEDSLPGAVASPQQQQQKGLLDQQQPWATEWDGQPLLEGCAALVSRADGCLRRGQEAQLEALKTQAMLLGATVDEAIGKSTTHVLVWAPAAFVLREGDSATSGEAEGGDAAVGGVQARVDAAALVRALATLCREPKRETAAEARPGGSAAATRAAATGGTGPSLLSRPARARAAGLLRVAPRAAPAAAADAVTPTLPLSSAFDAQQAGAAAAGAAPQAPLDPKRLHRLRRRLTTGRLHLVTAQWLIDAADLNLPSQQLSPGSVDLNEVSYVPRVVASTRRSSASGAQTPARASTPSAAAGAAEEHGEQQQQPWGLDVAKWPWREACAAAADDDADRPTSGSEEEEEESPDAAAEQAATTGRGSKSRGSSRQRSGKEPGAAKPAKRRAARKTKKAGEVSDAGSDGEEDLEPRASPPPQRVVPRRAVAAAAADRIRQRAGRSGSDGESGEGGRAGKGVAAAAVAAAKGKTPENSPAPKKGARGAAVKRRKQQIDEFVGMLAGGIDGSGGAAGPASPPESAAAGAGTPGSSGRKRRREASPPPEERLAQMLGAAAPAGRGGGAAAPTRGGLRPLRVSGKATAGAGTGTPAGSPPLGSQGSGGSALPGAAAAAGVASPPEPPALPKPTGLLARLQARMSTQDGGIGGGGAGTSTAPPPPPVPPFTGTSQLPGTTAAPLSSPPAAPGLPGSSTQQQQQQQGLTAAPPAGPEAGAPGTQAAAPLAGGPPRPIKKIRLADLASKQLGPRST